MKEPHFDCQHLENSVVDASKNRKDIMNSEKHNEQLISNTEIT